ncbi:MAG: hypothetical protein HY779_04925, partial [Rubrobacteridae bacterium]|nr:hypothetical protein [Rubrobacteridae bacterium]
MKIVKYFLTMVFVFLFGAVVVGFALKFDGVNAAIKSNKAMKAVTMAGVIKGYNEYDEPSYN